jgi:5-hydroxyisourate hydrolase
MMLTTHVLDTAAGRPAAGIEIALDAIDGETRTRRAWALTNADGRTDAPLAHDLAPGLYELTFAVAPYFARANVAAFYDTIAVRFRLTEHGGNYHVPLLLSPWGYSTYRGS